MIAGVLRWVNMGAWTPLRQGKHKKDDLAPRSRGRRRQRLPEPPAGQDSVLTDRDAAHAAEAARQARTRSLAPAWERFGSQPASPVRRSQDAGDGIIRLAEAERAAQAVIMGTTMTPGNAKAGPGYGTGPAYDPRNMR
jgi:hypothetical protein